jgi:hypothetical protein
MQSLDGAYPSEGHHAILKNLHIMNIIPTALS